MKKRLLFILMIILLLLVGCSKNLNVNSEEWIADLQYTKDELPKVVLGFYDFITEEEWEADINDLINDIKTKQLSNEYIGWRINEIITKVKISHMGFIPGDKIDFFSFPFIPFITSEKDYYVEATSKEYKELLGAKMISINEIPMKEITEKVATITPHETILFVEAIYKVNAFSKNKLDYLGITNESKNIFTFEMEDGTIKKIEIEAENPSEQMEWASIQDIYENKPIRYNKPKGMWHDFWYDLDIENKAFYFQYNNCVDRQETGDEALPYFKEFSKEMFEYMKTNNDEFNKIIVDVRNNFGGSGGLFYNYFIMDNLDYLKTKDIVVLIDKQTYSAGVDAVNDLYEKLNAKIIGTETGGIIAGYTEVSKSLKLKNTNSSIRYTTKTPEYYALLGRQTDSFRGVKPDVEVENSVEDFRNGIDKVYNEAVEN